MATIMPLQSLNPASVQKGTGAYTIPNGYHGFFSGSSSSASASAGGTAGGTGSFATGPESNPQTFYYGWGGSGSGSGSASASGSCEQWLISGSAITTTSTNNGTANADASANILIDAVTVFSTISRSYTYHTGSGGNIIHVGWSVSLFLNAP